jgi:hypothetical protein
VGDITRIGYKGVPLGRSDYTKAVVRTCVFVAGGVDCNDAEKSPECHTTRPVLPSPSAYGVT